MTREFLVDIDINKEMPKYELVLTKMNEEPLQELHNIENFTISKYHADIDEITFEIPFLITNSEGREIKNEDFELVDGSMMVKINEMQYFILTKPEITTDERTGEIRKKIQGFSREYELAQKRLSGYEAPSRLLYDHKHEKDETGLEIGFLNYIEKKTAWKIDYITSSLFTKYRHLNFSDSTFLQAFQEVQKTFGCLFQYNTINRTISVYDPTALGKHKGLYISDQNFIESLTQEVNHDEIKTRLYLYGKDNISIQPINITGQAYIENFSYYKNRKYMSESLINALDLYEAHIETKQGEFANHLTRLDALNENLKTKEITVRELEKELRIIESRLDIAIADGKPLEDINIEKRGKVAEIDAVAQEINVIEGEIKDENILIEALGKSMAMKEHFSETLLKELDTFVKEDQYRDNNYTEDNLKEFLSEGIEVLNKISYPILQFDVNVEDFLSLVEGQHIQDKLILGDIITLEHTRIGFEHEVRLIGYEHSPEENNLTLIFSNRDSIDDDSIYLRDLLDSLTTTSGTVDFSKFKWDKGEQAEFLISKYVDHALDLSLQNIVQAEGQVPIIDDRGIWLTKKHLDGTINDAKLGMIHNTLAITKDDWNSVEIALSAEHGINANLIRGKLGQFAEVDAGLITINPDGTTIVDDALGENILRQEEYYNGVKIDSIDGFVATRDDHRVRTTINATEGIKIETKENDEWLSNFYVDKDGNIKLEGNISLSGGFINWETVNKPEIPPGYTKDDVVSDLDYIFQESTYIDANGVWTPQVYANNINTSTAKIETGQIEELIVGSNVKMGANATIKWDKVEGKDKVLERDNATDKSYITEITNDTIKTTNVVAENLQVQSANIRGTITADTVKSDWVYTGNVKANQLLIGGADGRISFDDLSDTSYVAKTSDIPSDSYITSITREDITTAEIYARNLQVDSANIKGTITADSLSTSATINVGTDANIGKKLKMNATNFRDGIYFNTWSETSITVWDPNGGVYIKGGLVVDNLSVEDSTSGITARFA